MIRRITPLSLSNRVALTAMLLVVCGWLPVTYFTTIALEANLTELLTHQQISAVNNVAHSLEQRIELRIGALQDLANALPAERFNDQVAVGNYLKQCIAAARLFPNGIVAINKDGFGVADYPVVPNRATGDYREIEYFKEVLATGLPAIGKPRIGRFTHKPGVALAVPIRNGQGELVGVLSGFLGLTDTGIFDQKFAKLGQTGEFILASRTHNIVIADSSETHLLHQLEKTAQRSIAESVLDGINRSEIVKDLHGNDALVSAQHILSDRWVVLGSLPTDEAFAPVKQLEHQVYVASAVILTIIGSLMWWMMRVQLGVVGRTTQSLRKMAFGEEPLHDLPVTRNDEIGRMLEAFNKLQQQIRCLNQLYAALSQCNEAIVRSSSEEELFPIICKIAVQYGGMNMAWIGLVDEASKQVAPVAYYGEGTGYLEGIQISVDPDDPHSHGTTGTSIREGRPFWCQDFLHDAATALWRERGKPFGWLASASLPLFRNGASVGALNLYADSVNAFDEESRKLLSEMARNISFALDNFAREAQRNQAEKALRESEARFRAIIEAIPVPLALNDEQKNITYLNKSFLQTVGYSREDIPTLADWWPRAYPDSQYRQWVAESWQNHLEEAKRTNGAFTPLELNIRCKNGSARTFIASAASLQERFSGTHLVILYDITARKQSEGDLLKLSLAVEQSPNIIVITDLDANIEYVNSTFSKVTGYSMDEAIGKNPRFLQSGKSPKATYDDMWAHLTRGEIWRGELINRRKDGSEYIESTLISPVCQADGQKTNYLAIKEDITEKKAAEERIDTLAHFDQLTGLPNRAQLNERFKYALSLAQRTGDQLAVMFLDLDHFKDINDTLGHSVGDQLVAEVARRLKATLRDEDTVSRQGGDEFILILPGTDADGAALVASKLMEAVSQPCRFGQHDLIATPSIGIAIYPNDGKDFETLSKNADAAMYRVKQDTRNNFRFFTAEMQAHSARTLQLSIALRHALVRKEFKLHYQPQVSTQDGHIVGAEALLRWQHPELGMISPAEFIPVAEHSGQIIQIGEWVLRTAVSQLKAWMDLGLPPMVMAVNLSAVQFRQANIEELVTRILDEVKLPHEYLELELTEAVAMGDPQAAVAVMDKLHERGIRMSIDDFGTGYSSLSYLKKFKVYKLKIDQSFVRNITENPEDKAIVSAIITLASSLGLQTIAEGVETAGQLAFLRLQGCDEMQGYFFSKPLPAEEFEKFVINTKNIAPSA